MVQPGMMGRCRKRSGRIEHINETGFALVPLANERHGRLALHVQTYLLTENTSRDAALQCFYANQK